MTHYELLLRMGRATTPVQTGMQLYPSYIGYNYPCLPTDAPPPPHVSCTRSVSDLSDEELLSLITDDFIIMYPEFTTSDNNYARLVILAKQLRCRYPALACLDTDCGKDRFFLLLAHNLALPEEDGNGNAVTSAHVGDTSVSYDTSATQRLPWFFLQLSKTRYGRELISLLDNATGLVVV